MPGRNLLSGALALSLILAGCDTAADLLSPSVGLNAAGTRAATYSAALSGSSYDPAQNRTTLTYTVTSGSGPAISHWVLGFPDTAVTPTVVSSSDAATSFGVDPTTGLRGVKFDTGYDDGATRVVTLVLAGAWTLGEVPVAVKSGLQVLSGKLEGPVGVKALAAAVATYTLSGAVYFDADGNGAQGSAESGIPGVVVTLTGGAVDTTDARGEYAFAGLRAGSYGVTKSARAGLLPATQVTDTAVITTADATASFPQTLDFAALAGKVATGKSHGFWKSNVDKAIKGQTNGAQLSKATLEGYLAGVSAFALAPFNPSTLATASAALSATGSDPLTLLRKQLIASELNYFGGAYIGGDELVTRLFVWQGEHAVQNATTYTTARLLALKDWYDAYNNSYGAALVGPATLP